MAASKHWVVLPCIVAASCRRGILLSQRASVVLVILNRLLTFPVLSRPTPYSHHYCLCLHMQFWNGIEHLDNHHRQTHLRASARQPLRCTPAPRLQRYAQGDRNICISRCDGLHIFARIVRAGHHSVGGTGVGICVLLLVGFVSCSTFSICLG